MLTFVREKPITNFNNINMKKLSLFFAALCLMTNLSKAQEVYSGIEELDEWTKQIKVNCSQSIGYPCNQNIHLKGFYQWFYGNNLQIFSMNNAGDPFTDKPFNMSSQKFEKEVIQWFAPLYGFEKDKVWGIVTMSGTDGNDHGIYFGRKCLVQDNPDKGAPIMYVSDEAHYSNFRLADLQQVECRLVKSDHLGRMIPEELEKALDPSRPCLIVYAMGSTFKGAIDDQKTLNAILDRVYPDKKMVYRHIDAALFGGYLPFTENKDMVSCQVQPFNSISVSGHKFFSIDSPCGLFICGSDVYDKQTDMQVEYLNNSMRMISCSRSAKDPLKFWWMIHKHGAKGWTAEAKQIVEMSDYLYNEIKKIGYPVYRNEHSNTIMFKRPSEALRDKYTLANGSDKEWGELSHIVVMQHVTKEMVDEFVTDLKAEAKK